MRSLHINNAFLAARAEILFFDNVPMDKLGLKNERLTNLEYLGTDMIEAGNEFGTETPYGSALIRVGQSEQRFEEFLAIRFYNQVFRLGSLEKEYIQSTNQGMILPLQR